MTVKYWTPGKLADRGAMLASAADGIYTFDLPRPTLVCGAYNGIDVRAERVRVAGREVEVYGTRLNAYGSPLYGDSAPAWHAITDAHQAEWESGALMRLARCDDKRTGEIAK